MKQCHTMHYFQNKTTNKKNNGEQLFQPFSRNQKRKCAVSDTYPKSLTPVLTSRLLALTSHFNQISCFNRELTFNLSENMLQRSKIF
eukprot:scaffold16750_cov233-Skeletonema_marinoi.AAC.2